MEGSRRVMICRKVMCADGVARVVLEPAENTADVQNLPPTLAGDSNHSAEEVNLHFLLSLSLINIMIIFLSLPHSLKILSLTFFF